MHEMQQLMWGNFSQGITSAKLQNTTFDALNAYIVNARPNPPQGGEYIDDFAFNPNGSGPQTEVEAYWTTLNHGVAYSFFGGDAFSLSPTPFFNQTYIGLGIGQQAVEPRAQFTYFFTQKDSRPNPSGSPNTVYDQWVARKARLRLNSRVSTAWLGHCTVTAQAQIFPFAIVRTWAFSGFTFDGYINPDPNVWFEIPFVGLAGVPVANMARFVVLYENPYAWVARTGFNMPLPLP